MPEYNAFSVREKAGQTMRKIKTICAIALCTLVAGAMSPKGYAGSEPNAGPSVLRISDNGQLPQSRSVSLGAGKSLLVEFDFELRDVLVSDPSGVDAVVQTSNRVFLIAKRQGQTNAFFFDADGNQVLTLDISVGADSSGLEDLLARLIPGSNIRVELAGRSVVLTGTVRSPSDSHMAKSLANAFVESEGAQLMSMTSGSAQVAPASSGGSQGGAAESSNPVINLLSVEAEEQVMLRVQVAEVQRTLLKQFGINLGAAINSGNFSTAVLTDNALPLTAAAGLGGLPVPGLGTAALEAGEAIGCTTGGILCNWNSGPSEGTFGNSGTNGGFTSGNTQISHTMRALERDGLLRMLAEPTLTAVSGESAKFLAGGEFPVLEPSGLGQTTVQFKPYGIGISFTPTVLSEGRISLKIESEVSELTNTGAIQVQNISIPALKTRKANSTVELPSGGALALAGLISDSTRQNIDGFPGLKDLPVLGTLFRSRDFVREETELVVIVTPYLVRPVAPRELAKPIDGLAAATDRRANFMGHLNRIYGAGSAAPVGDLKGDYGFIIE